MKRYTTNVEKNNRSTTRHATLKGLRLSNDHEHIRLNMFKNIKRDQKYESTAWANDTRRVCTCSGCWTACRSRTPLFLASLPTGRIGTAPSQTHDGVFPREVRPRHRENNAGPTLSGPPNTDYTCCTVAYLAALGVGYP